MIIIPVVVHVIHNGEPVGVAPNITDAQVISQITAMNNDFRRMAGTLGHNTDPVGADTMIQFALAKVDPNGNPTNGINRVNMCSYSWSTGQINSIVKPQTIWDPNFYMNMWSVRFSNSSLLGYAQFPSGSGLAGMPAGGNADTDGVVAKYNAFGSSQFNDGTFLLSQNANLGRTMTHEVGHYLGLRHLWGDGLCDVDDYCADTPVSSSAGNAHYNCNPSQDSCPSSPGLDMVRNYMNYTMDACMNIFTVDQTARMTAVMNNSPRRSTLVTSTRDQPIPLFPNDAELKIENSCAPEAAVSCTPVGPPAPLKFSIYNRGTSALTAATVNLTLGGVTQQYNWTGNLAPNQYSVFEMPVNSGTPSSVYTATITNVNGAADQRASNNSVTGNYVNPEPQNYQFTDVKLRLQLDMYGSEISWNLKNSAGTTLYSGNNYPDASGQQLPSIIEETWALAPNGCYVFTINDSFGDGLCCDGGPGFYELRSTDNSVLLHSGSDFGSGEQVAFKIMTLSTADAVKESFDVFPIPVGNILNVSKVSDKASYQIINAAGQQVSAGTIRNNQIDVAHLTPGNYIITVKDKDFNGSVKFIKK